MSRTIIIKCDRCGKELPNEELRTVNIVRAIVQEEIDNSR